MAEEVLSVKVSIEVDTNKQTIREEWDCDDIYDAEKRISEFVRDFGDAAYHLEVFARMPTSEPPDLGLTEDTTWEQVAHDETPPRPGT